MLILTRANLADRASERWASFLWGPPSQNLCHDAQEEQELPRVVPARSRMTLPLCLLLGFSPRSNTTLHIFK